MNAIAIYLRLSEEDIDRKNESNSIIGQRFIIENYIQKNELYPNYEIHEFVDDGYSGTNMNRPGMTLLLEKLKLGKIKCIIVKDLSRFSRDYLELGSYMEQIFPFMQVRFISINDGYDSEKSNGGIGEIDVQFKALLYDFYSKDLSKKVKSSREAKLRTGKAITWAAPYGYIKDPNDSGKFIIDKATAPIVKMIYQLALEELSLHKIAKILNEKKIPTPAMRKKELTNMTYNLSEEKPKLWNLSSLSRITSNYMYAGALVSNTSGVKEIGSGRSLPNSKEKWIIIEDVHEPIVSKEDFERVQDIKKTREGTYRKGNKTTSPLKDVMECGCCKRKMSYGSIRGIDRYFYCRMSSLANLGCTKDKIKAENLEDTIFKAVNRKIRLYYNAKQVFKDLETMKNRRMMDIRVKNKNDEAHIAKTKKIIQSDYEKLKFGKLTKDEFLIRKNLVNEEVEKLRTSILSRVEDNDRKNSSIETEIGLIIELNNHLKATELTKEIIDALIEKIIFEKEDKIEIVWKFDDKLLNKMGHSKE